MDEELAVSRDAGVTPAIRDMKLRAEGLVRSAA
jgi:hypothetical protein